MDDLAPADATPLGLDYPFARRQLIQVVYRSRSITDADGERDILEAFRRNNPARGIAGVLVSHGGWIMQVLGGPAAAVSDLLARIDTDTRNGELLLISAAPIDAREFGDRSMGSTSMDDDCFLQLLDSFVTNNTGACRLLRDFILSRRQPWGPSHCRKHQGRRNDRPCG
jgi:hypothetical protein